jgi:hypothetical protein
MLFENLLGTESRPFSAGDRAAASVVNYNWNNLRRLQSPDIRPLDPGA